MVSMSTGDAVSRVIITKRWAKFPKYGVALYLERRQWLESSILPLALRRRTAASSSLHRIALLRFPLRRLEDDGLPHARLPQRFLLSSRHGGLAHTPHVGEAFAVVGTGLGHQTE